MEAVGAAGKFLFLIGFWGIVGIGSVMLAVWIIWKLFDLLLSLFETKPTTPSDKDKNPPQ